MNNVNITIEPFQFQYKYNMLITIKDKNVTHLSPAVHGENCNQHWDDPHQLPESDLDNKKNDAGDEEDDQD